MFREFRRARRKQKTTRRVEQSVRTIQSGEDAKVGTEDLLVLSLVRDEELRIAQFVEYYLGMGAARIVVLDNGSRDGTLDLLAKYPQVTVLQSTMPYKTHKNDLKRYLVRRLAQDRWALTVDADEHFDFPYSSVLGITGLLAYLNANGFTSVVCYLLDLFADGGLCDHEAMPHDRFSEIYRFYDLSSIVDRPYEECRCVNYHTLPPVPWRMGGIRKSVFEGGEPTRFWLTKHPLIRHVEGVRYRPAHRVGRAKLADLTGVLYHYKFLSNLAALAERIVAEGSYAHDSFDYKQYQRVLDSDPNIVLKRSSSRELRSAEQLIDEGFLFAGENFLDTVQAANSN